MGGEEGSTSKRVGADSLWRVLADVGEKLEFLGACVLDKDSLSHHYGSLKGLGCRGRKSSWWACRAPEGCYLII